MSRLGSQKNFKTQTKHIWKTAKKAVQCFPLLDNFGQHVFVEKPLCLTAAGEKVGPVCFYYGKAAARRKQNAPRCSSSHTIRDEAETRCVAAPVGARAESERRKCLLPAGPTHRHRVASGCAPWGCGATTHGTEAIIVASLLMNWR